MTHALPHAAAPVVGTVVVPGSKSETNRALVLAALAEGPVSTMCPGSILQMHRTVTVVVDEAAASKV